MWGVVGLVVTMNGTAPMAPVESPAVTKKRRRRCLGSPPSRSSRRKKGEEPVEVLDGELGSPLTKTREIRSLLRKGGRGRKFYDEDCHRWEYFPQHRRFFSRQEREKHNADIFNSLREDSTNEIKDNDNETRQENNSSYQLLNVKNLENLINQKCQCQCRSVHDLQQFIEFCEKSNNQTPEASLRDLKKSGLTIVRMKRN